jgi:hypothetical protein
MISGLFNFIRRQRRRFVAFNANFKNDVAKIFKKKKLFGSNNEKTTFEAWKRFLLHNRA